MKPYILEETDDFAVVFKPPRMHSARLKQKTDTIMDWYAEFCPQAIEHGGLLHRLDFETQGLLLVAKNRKSLEYFRSLQESGGFVKEYGALGEKSESRASGFPPPPSLNGFPGIECSAGKPFLIKSFFRPFGQGRKQVRPVIDEKRILQRSSPRREIAKDRGNYYRTEIIGINDNYFTIRIKRGFRHQIRCHLSWIGFPILNDPLYGAKPDEGGFLALRAHALFFSDPESGLGREYRIDSLHNPCL